MRKMKKVTKPGPPPKPQFPLHPYQHYTYEIRLPMVNGKSTPEYSYVMF